MRKSKLSRVVAEEMSRLIEAEEIKGIEGLENSLREMLKEVCAQTCGKVLEKEDDKLGSEWAVPVGRRQSGSPNTRRKY